MIESTLALAERPLPVPAGDYSLCGWRVASEIALPELAPWIGDDRAPDVTIMVGPVADAIESPILATPVLQLDDTGRARFHLPAVATFLIEQGRRITVAPRMPIDAPDIRLFLLGTPFGLICHYRGVVPLHAATVEIDGEAVSFAGASGVGKSTLAAAFWRRGHRVLSDDVAPFLLGDDGAMILPGLRRIRLWQDSVEAAGWNPGAIERCRLGIDKFSQSVESGYVDAPLRPRALFNLQRQAASAGDINIQRLRGRKATELVSRQVYRSRALEAFVGKTETFLRSARVAAAIPQHFQLNRPFRYTDLDSTVDMIIDTVRGAR